MFVLLEEYHQKINLKECILIIPSVSVGNVGQLAADLLISSLGLVKVGYIRHRNILPVVAYNEGNKSIATECEMFGLLSTNIIVVQIRSSYGPFCSISPLMAELGNSVKAVVILSGSFAYERKNINLINDSIRFLSTDALEKSLGMLLPTEWQKINNVSQNSRIRIPGSGIADHLFNLFSSKNIPALIIVNYVSEGDNREDAVSLVNYIDSWLHLRKGLRKCETSWSTPNVWSSLFGNSFPAELF